MAISFLVGAGQSRAPHTDTAARGWPGLERQRGITSGAGAVNFPPYGALFGVSAAVESRVEGRPRLPIPPENRLLVGIGRDDVRRLRVAPARLRGLRARLAYPPETDQ